MVDSAKIVRQCANILWDKIIGGEYAGDEHVTWFALLHIARTGLNEGSFNDAVGPKNKYLKIIKEKYKTTDPETTDPKRYEFILDVILTSTGLRDLPWEKRGRAAIMAHLDNRIEKAASNPDTACVSAPLAYPDKRPRFYMPPIKFDREKKHNCF